MDTFDVIDFYDFLRPKVPLAGYPSSSLYGVLRWERILIRRVARAVVALSSVSVNNQLVNIIVI